MRGRNPGVGQVVRQMFVGQSGIGKGDMGCGGVGEPVEVTACKRSRTKAETRRG